MLLLELTRPQTLPVGRLGALRFSPGLYAYVGSAHGPGGLAARLNHHLKVARRCHWHIDYLRRRARVVAVWAGWEAPATPTPLFDRAGECRLAHLLADVSRFRMPFKGFGSSDCTCYSHLLHRDCSSVPAAFLSACRRATIARVHTALGGMIRFI